MLLQHQVDRGYAGRAPRFQVAWKKELLKSEVEYKVDGTESPVERQKKQRRFYSGKKKRHTMKTQVIAEQESKKIVCTKFSNGKKHDFRLFKESKVRIYCQT